VVVQGGGKVALAKYGSTYPPGRKPRGQVPTKGRPSVGVELTLVIGLVGRPVTGVARLSPVATLLT